MWGIYLPPIYGRSSPANKGKSKKKTKKSRESLKSLLAKKRRIFRQNMYAVCEQVGRVREREVDEREEKRKRRRCGV